MHVPTASETPDGDRLMAEARSAELAEGELRLWPLGQQGYLARSREALLCFDAFLSPSVRRRVPPQARPSQMAGVDVFFGSHDHGDHIDRPSWPALAEASPEARFVVPAALVDDLAAGLGIPAERFVGLDDGVRRRIDLPERPGRPGGTVVVTGVAAAHEFLDRDPATGRYPYLGYLVETDGRCLYHAGDTCLYEGLIGKLRRRTVDVAMLPINGRDAKRLSAGCIGNMTYQEAADLAGAVEPGLTVPGHWDLFAENPGDPEAFCAYMAVKYPHLPTAVGRPGSAMRYPPAGPGR